MTEDAETYRDALEALHQVHVATVEAMALRNARIRVLEDTQGKLVAALNTLRCADFYGKTHLGFISDSGCWSVEWPADGLGILREWIATRDAALKQAESRR